MEYTGWTLYDDVTLVIRKENHREYGCPQAYVVDPKNKKQLQSAMSWGEITEYKIINEETKEWGRVVTPPNVITIKNEGFRIQLLDCADGSYHGGKLSFWNCLITNEKYNIKVAVGIDANLLLTLLLQNEFKYGYLEKDVMFGRMSGGVGLITEDMKEYQDAIRDMQTKKDITKKKTSRWQLGKNYITLTLDEVYLGDLYKLINIDYVKSGKGFYDYSTKLGLMLEKDPNRRAILDTSYIRESGAKSLKELLDIWKAKTDSSVESIREKLSKSPNQLIDLRDIWFSIPLFNYGNIRKLEKLPARQRGDFELEIDMDINNFYKSLIEHIQDKVIELSFGKNRLYTRGLEEIIIRTGDFNLNNLTARERKIIDIIKSDKDIEISKEVSEKLVKLEKET